MNISIILGIKNKLFIYSPIYVKGPCGTLSPNMRYSVLDSKDETAKKILRAGKRAAVAKDLDKENKAIAALRKILEPLDTGKLNHLAVMYMVVPVNTYSGATGAGSIWAKVSNIINNTSLDILRSRPMFEIYSGNEE